MEKKNLIALILSVVIVSAIAITIPIVLLIQGGPENGTNGPTLTGRPFTTVWNTSITPALSGSNQIRLPLESSGTYSFQVDWGDNTTDTILAWNQAEVVHTYDSEGVYTINITGKIVGWCFNAAGDCFKILEVKQWGDLRLGNSGSYFSHCKNLIITATDVLVLTGTTNLKWAFLSCTKLDTVESMNEWDVSSVTNMYGVFQDATYFNQNISKWDVSSVTTMEQMFFSASSFNQDISNWDVSHVTNMRYLFGYAYHFNKDIGNWDVSSVTNMQVMFFYATDFNRDIGGWDVSSVWNMEKMFEGVTLSTTNYDNLLKGWSSLSSLQSGVQFHAGNSKYSSDAADERQSIIDNYSWTITDGGQL